MQTSRFDFEDFLRQVEQMRRETLLGKWFWRIPGVQNMLLKNGWSDGEKEMTRFEAVIRSMTVQERRRPEIITAARRKRIAAGAAVSVSEVNSVLTRFEEMNAMMQQFH